MRICHCNLQPGDVKRAAGKSSVSLESRVDAQLLRSGNLSDADWEKLIEGAGTIGKSHLIMTYAGISISELRSKV